MRRREETFRAVNVAPRDLAQVFVVGRALHLELRHLAALREALQIPRIERR
jgi:hypothetical protein